MSWQTPRERDFSLAGPFIAKRAGNAGDLELQHGAVYTAAELHDAGNTDRHIQRMYAAHWLDMAPPADLAGTGGLMEALGGGTPTELTGLAGALLGNGQGNAENTGPQEPEGDQGPEDTGEGPEALETPEIDPEADLADGEPAAGDQNEAEEGGQPPEAAEGGEATSGDNVTSPTDADPTDTVITSYKCFGFGGYWATNAAGQKLGNKLSKSDAAGRANSAAVPLLGQDGSVIPQE